ncbi:hypothetical protein BROC_02188 [Candidatus Brocadiaceae bacterium]|nr:hypothetical protein BROC_02188 [Candidatus Brocadiaceae bacterium]
MPTVYGKFSTINLKTQVKAIIILNPFAIGWSVIWYGLAIWMLAKFLLQMLLSGSWDNGLFVGLAMIAVPYFVTITTFNGEAKIATKFLEEVFGEQNDE